MRNWIWLSCLCVAVIIGADISTASGQTPAAQFGAKPSLRVSGSPRKSVAAAAQSAAQAWRRQVASTYGKQFSNINKAGKFHLDCTPDEYGNYQCDFEGTPGGP
jgi:hypothetical protein